MEKGYLALVLHAHLPYVRNPDDRNCLEEKWLFEALTETYIPLIQVFRGLIRDNVDFGVTLSLSPPLVSMMLDPLLKERYCEHIEKLITLAEREKDRTAGTEFFPLAEFYASRFKEVKRIYADVYKGNLINAFKDLRDSGKVELITCGATHGYLPLMLTKEAMSAQVKTAVEFHQLHFGSKPEGIWLPECGYVPGVDEILKENELKYFFTDTHGILHATPRPKYGVYSPLYTPAGVAAFGRDVQTSRQVWDKNSGYPGDYNYREFYRDIGFDLDMDYIGPFVHPEGIRIDTGFKYYRITGKDSYKEIYNPRVAMEKAAEHAGNFMFNRGKQVEYLSGIMDKPPIIVSPYDAELFGHWWFEGPDWINYLCRKIAHDQNNFKMITPKKYLNKFPTNQVANLPLSSWGDKGYNQVWLDPANDWIYRHLHKAEERILRIAHLNKDATGIKERVLNQAARELLLAQSSDWAFIMQTDTAVEYAVKRTKEHIGRFNRLCQMVEEDNINEAELAAIEQYDNIFPELNFRVYLPRVNKGNISIKLSSPVENKRILMLAWEFPPKTVGGLARHVYDLTRAMVAQDYEVHVITCHVPGVPADENVQGVWVHRVEPFQSEPPEFLSWVMQLNLTMVDRAIELINKTGQFDVIHAHDWLVAHAARTIKKNFDIPLIATIHATEYGRNHGIHNDMQRYIHDVEWWLTYEAWRVIVCSKYMAREVAQIYQLPDDKIRIIANGVDHNNLKTKSVEPEFREKYAADHEKVVFFMGRLVPEKGVQVFIDAMPKILAQYPDTKFIISGKGPYESTLVDEATRRGISDKVLFTGFINDEQRNRLLQIIDVAVFPSLYEPFGIVALETMAVSIPTVVSDTGGLGEIIEHGVDGLKAYPGNSDSLADNIIKVLKEETLAREIGLAGRKKVLDLYNWHNIARQTIEVYQEVFNRV